MKYLVLVAGGAADAPCEALRGRTPLESARTPSLDRLAREGLAGGFASAPPGADPSTETSLLTLLGYDVAREGIGRGPLEALGLGVELREDELAFRVNYVILRPGATSVVMQDPVGGISAEEAESLRLALLAELPREEGEEIRILPGGDDGGVMTWRREGEPPPRPEAVRFSPPHAIVGEEVGAHLPPDGPGRRLVHLVNDSQMILQSHPLNRARAEAGRFPVNSLWPWGPGGRVSLESLRARWGLRGVILGEGPLLAGLARALGCVFRPSASEAGAPPADLGATGRLLRSALAEEGTDFLLCHVGEPDEFSHRGDVEGKVRAIECFDGELVAPLLEGAKEVGPFRLLVLADHVSRVGEGSHGADPVPFALAEWEGGGWKPPRRGGLGGLMVRLGGGGRSGAERPRERKFSEKLAGGRAWGGASLLRRLLGR